MVRPAKLSDVPQVQQIINSHAQHGKMLFKSYADLYEGLRNFAVAEVDGEVVGCVALAIIWADLCELRSLAVEATYTGRGIGRQLVEWAVDEARRLGLRRVMTLTYEQSFFERFAFNVVAKEQLPLKVWTDCVKCPKNLNCDEIAMVRDLPEVATTDAPVAIPVPRGISIPVMHEED